jgi:Fe-S-cluster containining protein
MNSLVKVSKELANIFKGISNSCKDCDLCCFTYGWILPSEVNKYSDEDLLEINQKVLCFDSFRKNSSGERKLEEIPRCKFYKNNRCVMQNYKPFDCLLYPVKILYEQEEKRFKVVLSLDCPFIKSLNDSESLKLEKDIKEFFDNLDEELLTEYLTLVKEWSQITKAKNFPFTELMYFEESRFDL